MIIYEVNLMVERAIYPDYLTWLKAHMADMLNFPGFLSADLAEEIPDLKANIDKQKIYLTVRYTIDALENLDRYLEADAPAMRAAGLAKFGDKFSATRRVFRTI